MIKSYKKGKIRHLPEQETKKKKENIVARNKKNGLNYKKTALYVLPSLSFLAGITLLFFQIFPTLKFFIEERYSNKYTEIISPVPEEDLSANEFEMGGNFEAQYFADLLENIKKGEVAGAKLPYKYDWEGVFYLNIPSVGIDNMPVTANTNSYDKSIYDKVLEKSLAHFKGTDLPAQAGENRDTNTLIYGHSAPGKWAVFHRNSFEAAFNPLFDVNIGDKIFLKFDGQELAYTVVRIKITKPEETNLLQGIPGQKTLILVTCAPPGSKTNRLNIVAKLD